MYWYEDDVKGAAQKAAQLTYAPAMIFYGSSSIRLWESLEEDFEAYQPVNLGFGGSTLEACVYFFERLVGPYTSARQLVIYAGDNDLGDGKQPEEVLYHFTQLVLAIQAHFPQEMKVFYLSIKPSIARWDINEKIIATNSLIENAISTRFPAIQYINVYNAMLGKNNLPNHELFAEDGLHLSSQGYEVWKSILLPVFASQLATGESNNT